MDQKKYVMVYLCLILPLIFSQASEDKINNTLIHQFPDYPHDIYAGYLNLTNFDKSFYYFYFQTQSGHHDDPVLLWLNGGPGCSSLMGMTSENGPFIFETNSTKMKLNEYSWNKNAHIIYLQSPAGVGFSQGKSLISNDTSVADDNLKALVLLFQRFPNLKDNDFYLTGQSYAGIYVPRLAEEILLNNQRQGSEERKINLKGILLGNACTHPTQCTEQFSRYSVQFLQTRGFLDDSDYSLYKSQCQKNEGSSACKAIGSKISKSFYDSGANIYNIYGKCYHPIYPSSMKQTMKNPRHSLKCSDSIGSLFLFNKNENRPNFHVTQLNDTLFWTPCSDSINYTSEAKATYSTIPVLVKAGLKIFYYSGDFDAMVPIQGTISWFEKYKKDFGAAVKKNWRPWYTNNNEFAGMVWELEGLTFISVSGAGHMVPTDRPRQAEEILNVFVGKNNWEKEQFKINICDE